VEFKINLLRPARSPRFEARARVLRPGRALTYCECEVFGLDETGEELVATMLSTIVTRQGR
jgi:acyl-coenzyme A thioesterase PaaI-like protein